MGKGLLLAIIFVLTGIVSDAGLSIVPTVETIPVVLIEALEDSLKTALPPLATEKYSDYIEVSASAYGPPLFPKGQATYSGDSVDWGDIAVDLKGEIPFKSRVQIFDLSGNALFGGKIFVAKDTGTLIQGARIDIWMPTLQEQEEWGVQMVRAKIIKGLEKRR